jgi:hypothetical protein
MEIPGEQGARLRKIFVGIEGWQARVELDPLVPAERSSLAVDDRAFPLMPASHIAYNGTGAVQPNAHKKPNSEWESANTSKPTRSITPQPVALADRQLPTTSNSQFE